MAYQPISSYGVIGDMHSIALVGSDGSIDWLCLPRFDSPSVFAKILDDEKGGYFRIQPVWDGKQKQMYLTDTNVLVTRFLSPEGMAEVVDFMPVGEKGRQIVRIAKAVNRPVRFRMECRPAFDYARSRHTVRVVGRGVVFESNGLSLALLSPRPVLVDSNGIVCEFTLEPGETATFGLRQQQNSAQRDLLEAPLDGDLLQQQTVRFWRTWMSRCQYKGRWREMVNRSALVLKLLTYEPTGAILAAATT